MIQNRKFWTDAANFLFIVAAYVLCHGMAAFVITPVQSLVLADITVFASLIYLPHGVRVLATWFWGWKAVLPLCVGAFVSELLFTPAPVREAMQSVLFQSILVGAMSAFAAFELFRLLGASLYAGHSRSIDWKRMLLVGALASLVNSTGQSIVFNGLILPQDGVYVFITYAVGDLAGLFVAMVALMMAFRWIRLSGQTAGGEDLR
ncbi:hypothetical protein [Actibacterium sp. D379-3]